MPIPADWTEHDGPRIFLAGIIQGSLPDSIHGQDYRKALRRVLEQHLPEALVYCPVDNHPDSLHYTHEQGRTVFLDHVEMAATSSVLVAFVPQASMGTAVEMWECYRRGVPIVTISPLSENWAVKFISTVLVPDLEAFEDLVRSGQFARLAEAEPDRA